MPQQEGKKVKKRRKKKGDSFWVLCLVLTSSLWIGWQSSHWGRLSMESPNTGSLLVGMLRTIIILGTMWPYHMDAQDQPSHSFFIKLILPFSACLNSQFILWNLNPSFKYVEIIRHFYFCPLIFQRYLFCCCCFHILEGMGGWLFLEINSRYQV